MPGRVSVVVPVFNNRVTLRRAVQSILAQHPAAGEIIVIDDGSTDGSVDSVRSLASNVRCLRQPHAGVAAARNLGMAAATGDYLAFLDADDYWLEGFLRETTRFLENHPTCGAVSSAYYVHDGKTTVQVPVSPAKDSQALQTGILDNFFEKYALHRHVCTDTVVLRREVFESAGPMRTDLAVAEDMEYWLRVATVTTWGFVGQPLAVYDRTRPDSLTRISVRRGLLPDIEIWQKDILLRLRPDDVSGFVKFREYFARTLTLNLLVQGFPVEAKKMARSGFVGSSGPIERVLGLLRWTPTFIWSAAGSIMRAVLAARTIHERGFIRKDWGATHVRG